MNFEGKIIKLREIDKLNVDNILDNQDFKYKNNDISFQIENAEKQFVMVDDYQLMVRTELCFGNCCFNIVSNKFFYRRFKKSRIYIENYIRFISER